jgi:hypothetical protein
MNPLKNFVEFDYGLTKNNMHSLYFIKLIFSLNLKGNVNNFKFVS